MKIRIRSTRYELVEAHHIYDELLPYYIESYIWPDIRWVIYRPIYDFEYTLLEIIHETI